MIRQTKYFLVVSCLLSLCVLVYRFARHDQNLVQSKTKIYSFKIGNDAVTIHQDGLRVENVAWLQDPLNNKGQKDDIDKLPTNTGVINNAVKTELRQSSAKVARPMVYRTTKKFEKVTTPKPVVVTKAATAKKVPLLKTTVPVVTVKSSGDPALCSKEGEKLVGPLNVDQTVPESEDHIDDDWDEKGWVQKGGAWRPKKCQAVSKVAIIIPYRKREQQLKIFLRHIHPMLRRQLLDYRIMVIEQAGDTPFNRAMLFNIGYEESLKFHDFKCFVFHDVDLIPENDKNYYGCPNAPKHLSVAIDKFNYRLPYKGIFGGVGTFRIEDFQKINGFSNKFWGWGGEDDDLYRRITAKGFKLTRPSMTIGRYKMVKVFHTRAKADPLRFDKLRTSKERMGSDGLNSLKYNVEQKVEYPLYTKVTVAVDPKAV